MQTPRLTARRPAQSGALLECGTNEAGSRKALKACDRITYS